MSMTRTVTLDTEEVEPWYPHKEWNDEALWKWFYFIGKINLKNDHERTDHPDGKIEVSQEQGPPPMRIFAGISATR